jgi:hypothetical protein
MVGFMKTLGNGLTGETMSELYSCPFGCGVKHRETLASEAQAYWYGVHWKECPNVERDGDV